jgi:GT2 family glycosyltransferase
MRPHAVIKLLQSISIQTVKPNQILIIDGSTDNQTRYALEQYASPVNLKYIKVDETDRGLTKQRNVGIRNLNPECEIVFFLDDDVILEGDFCERMQEVFQDSNVIGCDGLITNECYWKPLQSNVSVPALSQQLDGFFLKLSLRDTFRALLGLFPLKLQPGKIPAYGHGKSSLPPSGKCYEVDHIMGGITAYRKHIFQYIRFSTFFEGYGLYEDYDFSVRANEYGKLITNTAAHITHHHDDSGRPNTYIFGKMVVRNGWYVWRLKHPHPGLVNIFKWHMITLLLAGFRLGNILTTDALKRKQAWGDFCGRITAWVQLLFSKPTIPHLERE